MGLLVLAALALGRVPTSSRTATGALVVATLVLAGIVVGVPLPLSSDPLQGRLLASGVGLAAAVAVLVGLVVPVLRGRSAPLAARPMAWAVGMFVVLLLAAPGLNRLVLGVLPGVVPDSPSIQVIASLSAEVAMLLCLGGLVRAIAPLGWRELGFVRLPLGRVLTVGLAVLLVNVLVNAGVELAFEWLGLDRAHMGNVRPLPPGLQPPGFAQAVVTDALLPGSTEEPFFRGALFGALARVCRSGWPRWARPRSSPGVCWR